MKLFGYNLSLTRNQTSKSPLPGAAKRGEDGRAHSAANWLRGEESAPATVLSNAYQQVVWVYRAINALAEQVANIPFRFSYDQAGGDRLIASGPLPDFYARPHPQINRFQYWELRVIWLMLRGECIRVPIFSPPGTHGTPRSHLTTVLILDPAHFQHIVENHQLIGWRYTGLGRQAPLESQVFLPEEIWFEKLPNPFDFWRGLAPLALAAMAAKTDFAAGAFMRGLIENNADTGLIVRTEQQLDEEQQEQLLAALRERKRKAGTADRPLLLWNTAEVVKPELSSSDLQFLENRKFSRAEICAAFGVPEEIVTTTDTAKYDVMSGARLNFIENRVMPLCRRLEAEEEATVKRLDPLASGWFDLESLPILQEARRNRLGSAKTGFEMGVPFNELNRVLDLGFKPLPWGDRGFLPSAWQSIGATELSATSPAPASARSRSADIPVCLADGKVPQAAFCPPPIPAPERMLAWLQNREQAGASSPRPSPPGEERVKNPVPVNLDMQGVSPTAEAKLTRKFRRFLFEQRGRVLARLSVCGGAQSSSSACSSSAISLLDLAAENRLLLDRLIPLIRSGFEAACQDLAQARGVELLSVPKDAVQDFAASREPDLLELNQSTQDALAEALAESQSAQEPPTQLAARIRVLYNTLAAQTAPLHAARETTVAQQSAHLFLSLLNPDLHSKTSTPILL